MTAQAWRWLWHILGLVWLSTVIYLSLTPSMPAMGVVIWDKLQHFGAYFFLMAWYAQLYWRTAQRTAVGAGLVILGVALEYLQSLGVARQFEWADMLANTLGVIAAFILVRGVWQKVLSALQH